MYATYHGECRWWSEFPGNPVGILTTPPLIQSAWPRDYCTGTVPPSSPRDTWLDTVIIPHQEYINSTPLICHSMLSHDNISLFVHFRRLSFKQSIHYVPFLITLLPQMCSSVTVIKKTHHVQWSAKYIRHVYLEVLHSVQVITNSNILSTQKSSSWRWVNKRRNM